MGDNKTFKGKITAKGMEITVLSKGTDDDYISLTDIAKYKNSEFPGYVIQNWMRNRGTVEFLGLWEKITNPNFNYLYFEAIEKEAGKNSFVLTPKKWIENVNALYISKGIPQSERIEELNHLARGQLSAMLRNKSVGALKKLEDCN